MLKAKELRDQTIEELEASLVDYRKERFELLNEMKQTKKLEKPHQLNEKKKGIAKLMTVINEKKRMAKQES